MNCYHYTSYLIEFNDLLKEPFNSNEFVERLAWSSMGVTPTTKEEDSFSGTRLLDSFEETIRSLFLYFHSIAVGMVKDFFQNIFVRNGEIVTSYLFVTLPNQKIIGLDTCKSFTYGLRRSATSSKPSAARKNSSIGRTSADSKKKIRKVRSNILKKLITIDWIK